VDRVYTPTAVIYEQHGAMMRRDWSWLHSRWGPGLEDDHSMVYVAAGSHASYPESCPGPVCLQGPLHSKRPDGPHDGNEPWRGNQGEACQWTCLLRLPVTAEGEPALWNAFPGVWGRRVCIWWDTVCAQTTAPKSPGRTDRFLHPWSASTIEGP
jgi:hypothetical protein